MEFEPVIPVLGELDGMLHWVGRDGFGPGNKTYWLKRRKGRFGWLPTKLRHSASGSGRDAVEERSETPSCVPPRTTHGITLGVGGLPECKPFRLTRLGPERRTSSLGPMFQGSGMAAGLGGTAGRVISPDRSCVETEGNPFFGRMESRRKKA